MPNKRATQHQIGFISYNGTKRTKATNKIATFGSRCTKQLDLFAQYRTWVKSWEGNKIATVAKRSNLVGKITVRSEYKYHMLGGLDV
jgi:hypothetical protein